MKEIWKPLPVEPFNIRHLISNKGRIKRKKFDAIIERKASSYIHSSGVEVFLEPVIFKRTRKAKIIPTRNNGKEEHLFATLYHENQSKTVYVHKMVAMVFVKNPDPENYDKVSHLDGIKTNNFPENLYWTNQSELSTDQIHRSPERQNALGKSQTALGAKNLKSVKFCCDNGITEIKEIMGITGLSYSVVCKNIGEI